MQSDTHDSVELLVHVSAWARRSYRQRRSCTNALGSLSACSISWPADLKASWDCRTSRVLRRPSPSPVADRSRALHKPTPSLKLKKCCSRLLLCVPW